MGGDSGQDDGTIYRKDYKLPEYTVRDVDLDFVLNSTNTRVRNRMIVYSTSKGVGDLKLHGSEYLKLESVHIAGKKADQGKEFTIDPKDMSMTILKKFLPTTKVKQPFEIEIVNYINPSENKILEGMYETGGIICTQCEAEGFRNMTYFFDRPDCLARYLVRVQADKKQYPTLLSNGDCIRREELADGQHAAVFSDPFPKPAYLFAVIAGDLGKLKGSFTTMEGSEVSVECYAKEEHLSRCGWAMDVILRAMRYDEEQFGRVYDLSTLRLVALEDFNAGAMENKSLLTFNVSSILADKDTASDRSFALILSTVGHEYFHNWSGNRVTIRDWFQITLKEGFTSAREQSFLDCNFSHASSRIDTVRALRASQFREDASPLAHPIRLESYKCIDNFYTSTVYEKGSEVIEIFRTILGPDGFRRGCDLYFDRHDGQAVSCDEFIAAMADANNRDLSQMQVWYSQAGTPVVKVCDEKWNPAEKTYTFTLKQIIPPNALPSGDGSDSEKSPKPVPKPVPKPYMIPIRQGLVGLRSNRDLVPTKLIVLTKEEEQFTIPNVEEDAVLSLLRGFSAPIKLEQQLSFEQIAHLMAFDTDFFVQWECGQRTFQHFILQQAKAIKNGSGEPELLTTIPPEVEQGIREALKNKQNDWDFVAMAISMPPASELESAMKPHADPLALSKAAQSIKQFIAEKFEHEFETLFEKFWAESKSQPWMVTAEDVARRSIQNCLLGYLTSLPQDLKSEDLTPAQTQKLERALKYFREATNFNDKSAGFGILMRNAPSGHPTAEAAAKEMLDYCRRDASMVDSWARVMLSNTKTLAEAEAFINDPEIFSPTSLNPNRARALIGGFVGNPEITHANDGSGYMLLAKQVIRCDAFGSVANYAAKILINFQYYDDARKQLMRKGLEWVLEQKPSARVQEVVEAGLKELDSKA